MQEVGFIHDGCTRKGYIARYDQMHPELRFTYRPILSANRATILTQVRDATDSARSEHIASRTIAGQVMDWTLTDDKGEHVACTPENCGRLEPKLKQAVFEVVMRLRATDIDPEWNDQEQLESDEAALKAALGETDEEAARAKNSQAE